MAAYAGVDLGATTIRTAVGTGDGVTVGEDWRPTPETTDGREVSDAVVDSLRAACSEAGVRPERLRAVGVGTIGPLDRDRGAVVRPANLPVAEIPLEGAIESLVGDGKVRLQNDAVAGVIAERTAGGDSPDNVVYLTISSGIGAGVCVDGRVLRGRDGNAGEVGHFTIDPEGAMTCGCGSPGHWEAYCSGESIPRYARRLYEQEGWSTSLDLDGLTAADVFGATGDPLAERVIERVGYWNAVGIGNVVEAYAPREVVVGGAVALENPDRMLDPVCERIDEHVTVPVPEVRTTELGDSIVVEGALASVRRQV